MITQDNRITHFPPLDGLRGLSILLVMFSHFWTLHIFPSNIPINFESDSVDNFLKTLFLNGWIGVDIFFVLSGFLITGILIKTKSKKHYFKNFYARRTLRIFPVYYFYLLVLIFIIPNMLSHKILPIHPGNLTAPEDSYPFFLYLSNYYMASDTHKFPNFFTVTWSLAIEEQFYLFWPLLIYVFNLRWTLKATIGICIFCLLFRYWQLTQGASPLLIQYSTHTRIDSIAYGALAAILFWRNDELKLSQASLVKWAPKVLWGATISLLIFATKLQGLPADNFFVQTFCFTLLGIFGSSLILTVLYHPNHWIKKILVCRPLLTLGKFSYSLYLFHTPVLILMTSPILVSLNIGAWALPTWGNKTIVLITSFSLSLILSILSWHGIEKHFLKIKKNFEN